MISNKIITNINNDEIITYPLLLIKGKILHNNCQNENKIFDVNLNSHKIHNNYKFKNNQFKILLQLQKGQNDIKITYCCVSANLNIVFTERNSIHKIIPLYIINKNHNGRFQAPTNLENSPESACRRIETATTLLQCLIGEKLHEEGFGRKAFESKECKVFHSNLDVKEVNKMDQKELWEYLGREIMNSKIGNPQNKYLGFLSCTKYTGNKNLVKYEDMVKKTEGYVAIGGGGLALFGTACMYTWPETVLEVFQKFTDETTVDKDKFLNDSCYRNTLGACFSTTLGSVLHELCHTFDLGHTNQGVMGRGFDNIHKFFIELPLDTKCGPISNPSTRNCGFIRESKNFTVTVENVSTIYFTKSCSTLLCYHKFFNNYLRDPENFVLTLDRRNKFVRSTIGIRVIEIRETTTELVLNNWIFTEKILKYSFQIPEDITDKLIVIQDNNGHILKDHINIKNL